MKAQRFPHIHVFFCKNQRVELDKFEFTLSDS
jgi:hypothetical protein